MRPPKHHLIRAVLVLSLAWTIVSVRAAFYYGDSDQRYYNAVSELAPDDPLRTSPDYMAIEARNDPIAKRWLTSAAIGSGLFVVAAALLLANRFRQQGEAMRIGFDVIQ